MTVSFLLSPHPISPVDATAFKVPQMCTILTIAGTVLSTLDLFANLILIRHYGRDDYSHSTDEDMGVPNG